jgi:hypothetical protein
VAMPVSNPFAHSQIWHQTHNRDDRSYEEKSANSGKERHAKRVP